MILLHDIIDTSKYEKLIENKPMKSFKGYENKLEHTHENFVKLLFDNCPSNSSSLDNFLVVIKKFDLEKFSKEDLERVVADLNACIDDEKKRTIFSLSNVRFKFSFTYILLFFSYFFVFLLTSVDAIKFSSLFMVLFNGFIIGKNVVSAILNEKKLVNCNKLKFDNLMIDVNKLKKDINLLLNKKISIVVNNDLNKTTKSDIIQKIDDIDIDVIMTRISEVESKIILLPHDKENNYKMRLNKVVADFNNFSNQLNTGDYSVSVALDMKLQAIRTLKKELSNIENDVLKIISASSFNIKLSDLYNDFVDNLGSSIDKVIYLKVTMLKFSEFLNVDILFNISVADLYAKCFFETLKYLSVSDIYDVVNGLQPIFRDRIIIFGENILDKEQQNVNVLLIRQRLSNLKNASDIQTYLSELLISLKTINNDFVLGYER